MKQSRDKVIRRIEFVFYHEREIETAVTEERADPTPRHSILSVREGKKDPTLQIVLRELTPLPRVKFGNHELERPEEWLEAIEQTYSRAEGIERELGKSRYRRKENYQKFCIRKRISKSEYYRILEKFRVKAIVETARKYLIETGNTIEIKTK